MSLLSIIWLQIVELRYPLFVFAVFAFCHSFFAREEVKQIGTKIFGTFFVTYFWRFFYTIFSILGFAHFYIETVKLDVIKGVLFQYPNWYTPFIICIAIFNLVYYCILIQYMRVNSFYGLEQLVQGLRILLFREKEKPIIVAGENKLVTSGPYAITRHPMITTSFFVILCLPPVRSTIVFLILHLLYGIVGTLLEEARMRKTFGEQYIVYAQEVGAIFPKLSQWMKWLRKLKEMSS